MWQGGGAGLPIRMTWLRRFVNQSAKVNCKYGREIVRINISEIFDQSRPTVRVTGRLTLNPSDPEDFLYTLRQAKVAQVD